MEKAPVGYKGWMPGKRVDMFISHVRMDADEHFIFAAERVFPKAVGQAFPGIRHAKFGCMSTDRMSELEVVLDDADENTIFVGVGKGKRPNSFDEHEQVNTAHCAATLMVAIIPFSESELKAVSNALAAVLYEEKYGTEIPYEIPGVVKQLHDTEAYTEEEVRDWTALAYAAQIKNDMALLERGEWKLETESGWQLCVGRAYGYIKDQIGEKEANDWLEMAGTALAFAYGLKQQAREEVRAVCDKKVQDAGNKTYTMRNTRTGPVELLAITTNNRHIGSVAMNDFRFGVVIVRGESGLTQVMMDRRKKWCSCDACARLRDMECELRKLPRLTDADAFAHDSVLNCPWWNRFQEAPYIVNGTLKHSGVEPTVLTINQVIKCVEQGVSGGFDCPNWTTHHWLERKDSRPKTEEKIEKRKAIDLTLNTLSYDLKDMFDKIYGIN